MEQNTMFLSIGCSPRLVWTSQERSNNFKGSQILFEMEMRTNLWKDETKLGAECESWVPDGICKFMVTGEIDRMWEWFDVILTVYKVIELGDVTNLEHVRQLKCSDEIDISLLKDMTWCNGSDVSLIKNMGCNCINLSETVWARWCKNEIYAQLCSLRPT